MPQSPHPSSQKFAMKPPVYLQVDSAEFGPLKVEEVHQFMQKNQPKDQVYAWCKGLPLWTPIQKIAGFEDYRFERSQMFTVANDPLDAEVYKNENRQTPRKLFVASARIHRDSGMESAFGICLDLSLQGMQVRLEKPLVLAADEIVRFELFPLSISGIGKLSGKAKVVRYQADELKCAVSFKPDATAQWEQFKSRF